MSRVYNLSKRFILDNEMVVSILIHTFFFWVRSAALFFITFYNFKSATALLLLKGQAFFNILLFFYQSNLFILYLSVSSSINANIYKYYCTSVFIFHNGIAVIIILATKDISNRNLGINKAFVISISSLFFLEGIVTIYKLFYSRNKHTISLFNQIGIDKKIKNAFGTRKILQALGEINMFTALSVLRAVTISPSRNKFGIVVINVAFIFCAFVLQIFISVKFNDEDRNQRKVAIFMSYVKIACSILTVVFAIILKKRKDGILFTTYFVVLRLDVVIISVTIHYFLVKDYKLYGSGLKKYLQCKAQKINLSNKRRKQYQ